MSRARAPAKLASIRLGDARRFGTRASLAAVEWTTGRRLDNMGWDGEWHGLGNGMGTWGEMQVVCDLGPVGGGFPLETSKLQTATAGREDRQCLPVSLAH